MHAIIIIFHLWGFLSVRDAGSRGNKIAGIDLMLTCSVTLMFSTTLQTMLSKTDTFRYTCQLFLRYKREIFILGVLGFLKTTRSFLKIPEDVWSLPKAKLSRKRLSTKSEIARKVLSFIHFTHGFRSLHGSELTYFWKLCQARWQQLTFFNQAWEIGP